MIALVAAILYIAPALATQPVTDDPDDPAIWRNQKNPADSRVYGTNKVKSPDGAIYAYDLKGQIRQVIRNVDRPNNIDVLYGLATEKGQSDFVVTAERMAGQLRVFQVNPKDGMLSDVTGWTKVIGSGLAGVGEPMGVVCFSRGGKSFAVVSPKEGLVDGYLEQYELIFNRGTGLVDAVFLNRLGRFSGKKEIESLAYDPFSQTVWYSDEGFGNRRYSLKDQRASDAGFRLNSDFMGDHEGIDIWRATGGQGYLVCTDQRPWRSQYRVLNLNTLKPLGDFTVGADETDGIAIESRALGPQFPRGLMVVMDSNKKRYLYVDWSVVERRLGLKRLGAVRTTH